MARMFCFVYMQSNLSSTATLWTKENGSCGEEAAMGKVQHIYFIFRRLHARAGVDTDAINYATKDRTKMKAKFSHCDQIKFNEPVLKPGTPE